MATKNPMKSGRSFFVSFMRGFYCGEKPKVTIFTINPDVRLPATSACMPRSALQPRLVCNWFFSILHIFRSVCNTQIFQFIVCTIPVNVVNLSFWPFIIGHRPCNSVSAHKHIVHSNNNVSRIVKTCDNLSGSTLSPFDPPTQISRVRVIRKKLFKAEDLWMFHNGNMATLKPVVNGGKF